MQGYANISYLVFIKILHYLEMGVSGWAWVQCKRNGDNSRNCTNSSKMYCCFLRLLWFWFFLFVFKKKTDVFIILEFQVKREYCDSLGCKPQASGLSFQVSVDEHISSDPEIKKYFTNPWLFFMLKMSSISLCSHSASNIRYHCTFVL